MTMLSRLGVRFAGLFISLALAAGAQAQISDTTPPHLVSASFSPTSVNVTSAAQTVIVTVTATDDLSGMTNAQARFTSPSGAQATGTFGLFRSSGTPLSGVYTGTATIPRFSEAGTWTLGDLTLFDAAGNQVTYTTANLLALGLPVNLNVTSISDVSPPSLTGVSLSPAVIDVSGGPQNLTLTLDVTDNLSGVDFSPAHFLEFRVQLDSPSRGQSQFVTRPQFTQIAGSPLNGRWQAVVPFPRYSEAGTWSINRIQLIDAAGNDVSYFTAQIRALGLPTDFTVVSVPSDTTRPAVTGLSFSPSVFDTSTGSQLVTVSLRVTDNLAGVSFAPDSSTISFLHGVRFISPSGGQSRFTSPFGGLTLSAGTPLDGVWTGQVIFPQFSEAGTWRVSLDNIKDSANNGVLNGNYTSDQLAALGLPNTVTIFQPSAVPDGTTGPGGGTVMDSTFGNRALVTFPPGSVQVPTTVAIDVLSSSTDLGLPVPAGFTTGTLFVNIALTPQPPMPFPAPGLTLVLPFSAPRTPGARSISSASIQLRDSLSPRSTCRVGTS